ncbi:MAG: type II toxin-antitoxin system VapC family toxin [Bryobacteraceae bacterium]|jgi:ribonuclease VapC
MVIDTSALIAIALGEPSQTALLAAIEHSTSRELSSVSLLEAGIILRSRLGEKSVPLLYRLVQELGCEVIPYDEPQAKAAIAAFGRFGKGMGHRAQLNFGDCAVYALAALRGEPVLATGGDFKATDLMVAPF